MFTSSEKEVLQTVILKREQTAQEVAESQLTMNGSNGHLNTGKCLMVIVNFASASHAPFECLSLI